MGYAGFSAKKISRALFRWGGGAWTGAGIPTMQKCSMVHRATLTRFLLFCNELSATEIVDSLSSRRRGVSDFTQSPTRREIVQLGIE
jgi:hypothetical protein